MEGAETDTGMGMAGTAERVPAWMVGMGGSHGHTAGTASQTNTSATVRDKRWMQRGRTTAHHTHMMQRWPWKILTFSLDSASFWLLHPFGA